MRRSLPALILCAIAAAQTDPAVADFQKRIADYVKLHNQAVSKLGAKLKPTPSSERIERHEKRLGHQIREQRPHAKQGDIFSPEISAAFRKLIGGAVDSTATVHQSLRRSEPVVVPLHIGHHYPEGVPLQTTPPTLLQKLPQLPPELDYRIVGHALVLRDATANIIVDYLPNAMP